MSLPWGRAGPSALPTVPRGTLPGECEVKVVVPCDNVRRMMSFFGSSRGFSVRDAHHVGAPSASYEIEVTVRERAGASGLRVVRATIDGTEINEQLVLQAPGGTARFVGWLQDPTGAKRIRFTFPAEGGETSTVQVGVFAATEAGGKGKEAGSAQPPPTAVGDSFAGPRVSSTSYQLGEPIAAGMALLLSE